MILLIAMLLSQNSIADVSQASITVFGIVPVQCIGIENGAPKCNLELVQINENTWIDAKRGYTVKIENGQLILIGD